MDAQVLKADWTKALENGLKKSGLALPENLKIEFPYYGDLLKQLTDEALAPPSAASGAKRSGSISINEDKQIEFFQNYLIEISEQVATTSEEIEWVNDAKKKNRSGILNWEVVHSLLKFLDKKQSIGELALKNRTLDVFLYLTISQVKTKINEVVRQSFDVEPCVVVAHSLGTVVSYTLLRDNAEFQVKKFITVGSPLGSKTIQNLLGSKRMPASVRNGWFNAYDERDVVALNPLDQRHFNIQPPIENKNDVRNHTENRHSIEGYLDDPVVAQKIHEALVS